MSIAELELMTAGREGSSGLRERELFDPSLDSLWEISFLTTHRNSTEIEDAVYETNGYDLQAIQVILEGEIARNCFECQASLGRLEVAERHT